MFYIIAGTNRKDSRSLSISKIVASMCKQIDMPHEIIDLNKVPLNLLNGSQYVDNQPPEVAFFTDKIISAKGLILVCPEYNGSMPGSLKYFIDHWKFPDCFEFRPVAFVGLGGRFGGLRPIEHLNQIFTYRRAFIYPQSIILTNIFATLIDGNLTDEKSLALMNQMVSGFRDFTDALDEKQLTANYFLQKKSQADA